MDGQKEYFQQFLVLDDATTNSSADATSYEHYVQQMRRDGEWGGNMELIAASKLFQRNILVVQSSGAFLIDAPQDASTAREDLIVSYHDNGHYNSVWIAGRKTMLIQPRELTKVNRTGTIQKVMEELP
jgi:OTU domain-containing protein 3